MFICICGPHTPDPYPLCLFAPLAGPCIALLILIENKCSISCGGQKAGDCICQDSSQEPGGLWPAGRGRGIEGDATGTGRGQKFSKMQIIKWQPIKYANELCGVARAHTYTCTDTDTDTGQRQRQSERRGQTACTTNRRAAHIWIEWE